MIKFIRNLFNSRKQQCNIPVVMRSAFMRWANNWGRFNMYGDWKWYEYSPLEQRSKQSMTMDEMWTAYKNRHSA